MGGGGKEDSVGSEGMGGIAGGTRSIIERAG